TRGLDRTADCCTAASSLCPSRPRPVFSWFGAPASVPHPLGGRDGADRSRGRKHVKSEPRHRGWFGPLGAAVKDRGIEVDTRGVLRRLSVLVVFQLALAGVAVSAASAQGKAGTYIVVLKRGTDSSKKVAEHGRKYGVQNHAVYHHAIDGYSATIPASRLDDIRNDPDVTSVTPDVVAHE